MTPQTIRNIADALEQSDPQDSHGQRDLFERIRELRSAYDGPLDPESQRQLEAAAMLVAYLARMGKVAGGEVRTIAVRLLRVAADSEEASVAAHTAFMAASPAARPPETFVPAPAPQAPVPAPAADTAEQRPQRTASDVVGDMMLGQILLQRGQIFEEHIHQALKVQRATLLRMGDILVKIGACSRQQVQDALQHQASLRRLRGNLTTTQLAQQIETPETRGTGLKLVGEVMLGEILVERGIITRRQLERALEVQKNTGVRIGEALVQLGATTMSQIENALRLQGKGRRFHGSEADGPKGKG